MDGFRLTLFKKGRIAFVFHHAAMLGVKYTEDNKLDCLEINSTGTKMYWKRVWERK